MKKHDIVKNELFLNIENEKNKRNKLKPYRKGNKDKAHTYNTIYKI